MILEWTTLNMASYGRKRLSRLMWTELRFPWTDFLEKITRDPKMSLVYQDFFSKACDYISMFGRTLIWGFMGKAIVESMKWTSTYEFHVESVCWGVWDAECTVMLLLLAASFILGQWKSNSKWASGRQKKKKGDFGFSKLALPVSLGTKAKMRTGFHSVKMGTFWQLGDFLLRRQGKRWRVMD